MDQTLFNKMKFIICLILFIFTPMEKAGRKVLAMLDKSFKQKAQMWLELHFTAVTLAAII